MSVDLANASHYDVRDASQGYGVWTEDCPGTGRNWYFVMPNIYGRILDDPDGDWNPNFPPEFEGIVVPLAHGMAISWDGRSIRHCTSISKPDGGFGEKVGEKRESDFTNHLYGTFTAAKERIVQAGRSQSAAKLVSRHERDNVNLGEEDDNNREVNDGKQRDNSKEGNVLPRCGHNKEDRKGEGNEGDSPRKGVGHKNYLRTRKRNTIRESRKEHHNKRKGRGCKFDEVTNGEDKYVDGIGT